MGGGVHEISLPRVVSLRLPILILVLMAIAIGAFWPAPAHAQGSLQDLVGTYSLTERDVEGDWCANVPMDVQQVSTLDVTAIDDDSVSIAMLGGASFEIPFDSSARTFRYDISQSGYNMSITGQFVRGRDNVAMAMVFSWQPQIDCVASLTGSKAAPDLGYGETASAEGLTPGGSSDWGWLENPVVLALLALLMALTAAGVAFTRKRADPDPEPASSSGSGVGGPLAALTRSIAPLSGMPNPLSGQDRPEGPFDGATATGNVKGPGMSDAGVLQPEDFPYPQEDRPWTWYNRHPGDPDNLPRHSYIHDSDELPPEVWDKLGQENPSPDPEPKPEASLEEKVRGLWYWPDGSRVYLFQQNGSNIAAKSTGQVGWWKLEESGSMWIRWAPDFGSPDILSPGSWGESMTVHQVAGKKLPGIRVTKIK